MKTPTTSQSKYVYVVTYTDSHGVGKQRVFEYSPKGKSNAITYLHNQFCKDESFDEHRSNSKLKRMKIYK